MLRIANICTFCLTPPRIATASNQSSSAYSRRSCSNISILALLSISKACQTRLQKAIVGGGEKGYQFGGREGARCGVTLWPAVGAERGKKDRKSTRLYSSH